MSRSKWKIAHRLQLGEIWSHVQGERCCDRTSHFEGEGYTEKMIVALFGGTAVCPHLDSGLDGGRSGSIVAGRPCKINIASLMAAGKDRETIFGVDHCPPRQLNPLLGHSVSFCVNSVYVAEASHQKNRGVKIMLLDIIEHPKSDSIKSSHTLARTCHRCYRR